MEHLNSDYITIIRIIFVLFHYVYYTHHIKITMFIECQWKQLTIYIYWHSAVGVRT